MKRNTVSIVIAAVTTALLLMVAVGAVALVSSARRAEDRETGRADRTQRALDELRASTDQRAAAQDAVTNTARNNLPLMLSYDYRSLDRYATDVRTRSTKRFYDKFKLTIDVIRGQSAREPKSGAVLRDVAVRSIDATQARLLAFVDLTVTTTTNPGTVQRARIDVTFTKDGDDWLVDDLKAI